MATIVPTSAADGAVIDAKRSSAEVTARSRRSSGPSVRIIIVDHLAKLQFSHAAFLAIWWLIILIHVLGALVMLGTMSVFVLLLNFDNLLALFQRMGIDFDQPLCVATVIIYASLAAVHMYGVAKAIVASIRQRKLVFNSTGTAKEPDNDTAPCWSRWPRLARCKLKVAGIHKSLRVDGANFELIFMFREVTEITMQTIQCYRSNRYLGRAWVRHVGAFALVLNCWSTPLIRAIVHREDEGFARFLCLAVDIILDFWSSTLTPLIVGYGDFDLAMNKMSANFARSPYFFAQFHSDLQLGIPTSWLALLAQNFPSATMISSLNSMKLLIASRDAAVVPSYKPSSHRRSSTTFREIPVVKERKWFFRMLQVVHVLLALHGVVIFVFHMLATVNDPAANSVACQMPLKP